MYVRQIADREQFLLRAAGHPTRVTLCAEVVPEVRGPKVWMVPVLKIYYKIEFLDGTEGPTRWNFIEVRKAEEGSGVNIEGTVLHHMQQYPKLYDHQVDIRGPLVVSPLAV